MSESPDYELLYQHAPCSYLLLDDEGTITDTNATFLAWTGYQRDDVVGVKLQQLMPVGDRLLHSMHHMPQLLLADVLSEISLEIVDVHGQRRAALLTAVRVPRPDGSAEIRVIIFSAHERREYELDLVAALRRDKEVIERSAHLNFLKDDFIATINHEFRSPLATITGYLELVADGLLGPIAEDRREALNILLRNTARLNSLVENILTVSALDHSRTAPQQLDIADVLETVITSFKATAAAKSIQLISTLPNRPVLVTGHPGQLEEALRNVLRNSIQYTAPEGTVSLALTCSTMTNAGTSQVDAPPVPVQDHTPGHGTTDTCLRYARITVGDTGIGITTSDIPHVYTSFYRGSNIKRTSFPGSGLGLTITKQILDNHRGTIKIKSSPGRGTTVSIDIPSSTQAVLDDGRHCPEWFRSELAQGDRRGQVTDR